MNLRPYVSAVLLLFVAASVAWILFGDRFDDAPATDAAGVAAGRAVAPAQDGPAAPSSPASETSPGATPDERGERSRFVAWYLHGSMRCRTCRAIEEISHEAVDTAFAADIRDGRFEWRTANFENDALAPLVKRFGVTGSSLVIAEHRGDEVVRHRLLAGTWDLVDDRRGLMDYVVMEIDAFMVGALEGEGSATP